MVEQIEKVHPELYLDPLRYVEVLGEREVHRASRRPKAIPNRSVPEGAQLHTVQSVPIRVDPEEIPILIELRVLARLTRDQVRSRGATLANASQICSSCKVGDTDSWRVGGTAGEVDDGTRFPGA